VNRIVDPVVNSVHQLRVIGRFVRRHGKHPGTAPGTLVHTGPKAMDEVRISFLDYDEHEIREREVATLNEVLPFRDTPTVSWVNVDGLHDVSLVQQVGDHFGIHPLVLEDILSVGQRAKLEEYDDFLYIVVRMLSWNPEGGHIDEEQLSMILGRSWVFTFQERTGDHFDRVRERLRQAKGQIRTRGADYLAYALVDAVVDHYFHVLEEMGGATEELELEVLEDPTRETMRRLHHLKREMVVMRRAVWPLRDMANGLVRSDSPLIQQPTRVFLRDVYDHAIQIMDTVESLRDVVSGILDLYLSNLSNRTNEVMKVLTIMATIFIPLTFVAGVYGMNFDHMPELHVPWAYGAVWGVMVAIAVTMLVYFHRKGWL
jgi:magnesium transporter